MPDSASTKHQSGTGFKRSGVFIIQLENNIVYEWEQQREMTANKAMLYNSSKMLMTIIIMMVFFGWTIRFLELNCFFQQCRLCYIYGFVGAFILMNLFFERQRIEVEFSAKYQNVERGYKQRIDSNSDETENKLVYYEKEQKELEDYYSKEILSLKEKSRVLDKKQIVLETVFLAMILLFSWTGLALKYALKEKENYSAQAAKLCLPTFIFFVVTVPKIVITFADPKDTYWPIQKIWKI